MINLQILKISITIPRTDIEDLENGTEFLYTFYQL